MPLMSFRLAALIAFSILAARFQADAAMALPCKSNLKSKKVLVVTGGSGHPDPKARTLVNLKALATQIGFKIAEGDPKNLTDQVLAGYDIVVFNYFFQTQDVNIFPDASKAAFQRWLEAGKHGYIGYHTSGANEWAKDEWKWYQENVTGMRYALHGDGTPTGEVEITKDPKILELPIMQGLQPSFQAEDEWYNFETTSKIFDASLGYKFMYYLTNTEKISRAPAAPQHPVAWFREAPNGTKYFYATFIHTGPGADSDWFKSVLLRALEWESGYTGELPVCPGVAVEGKGDGTGRFLVGAGRELKVGVDGAYHLSVFTLGGQKLYSIEGSGKRTYRPEPLRKAGIYVVKLEARGLSLTRKILIH